MSSKGRTLTTNTALASQWFRPELLPLQVEVSELRLAEASRVLYADGVKLFLVAEGSGTLIVNGERYTVGSGCCGLLYCSDFHRFVPSAGTTMRIIQCCCSFETFTFAAILPGNELSELQVAQRPIAMKIIRMKDLLRINHVLEKLVCCGENDASLKALLLYEVLARMNMLWKNDSLALKLPPQVIF